MSILPSNISSFLLEQHVVSLATVSAGEPWAASCFYTYDAATETLIVLTSPETRHGAAMLAHAVVAGTVAGQPRSVRAIRGVQFLAQARLLSGPDSDQAYALYCARHPMARLRRGATWRIVLLEAKLTDNARLFGSKTVWRRQSDPA